MQLVRVAVDVNGGDFGSRTILEGVLEAVQRSVYPCCIYLCGDRKEITALLQTCNAFQLLTNGTLVIEQCSQSISPQDIPTRVWKVKKDASIIRCISLQKEGVVHASLSAGDTRIIIGASLFLLGRMKGVSRPALAAFMPTTGPRQCLFLDVGANINCRAEHLVSFGLMGFEYVKQVFGIEKPKVMLLNVGRESSKGTKAIIDAGRVLLKKCRGYAGFIEGSRVLTGEADVIVSDGFTGNVLLKTCESLHLLAEAAMREDTAMIQMLRQRMTVLNPENYGAVPLLGLQGIIFKAHGSSTAKAIAFALTAAIKAAIQRYT